jgi:hypothetical protein
MQDWLQHGLDVGVAVDPVDVAEAATAAVDIAAAAKEARNRHF